MQTTTFLSLQKKIYELSPHYSLSAINQILEQCKEMYPHECANNLLWITFYGLLQESKSKKLDFLIFEYMKELENKTQLKKAA